MVEELMIIGLHMTNARLMTMEVRGVDKIKADEPRTWLYNE